MRAETAEGVPDVVPDGLDAEVKRLRDLHRRLSCRKQVEDLSLPLRQRTPPRAASRCGFKTDDAEHPRADVGTSNRDGADFRAAPAAIGSDDFDLVVGRR